MNSEFTLGEASEEQKARKRAKPATVNSQFTVRELRGEASIEQTRAKS